MACCTSRLALSAAAVLLAVLLGVTTAAVVPNYCARGKAIPQHSPLSACVWYVASRSCDVAAAMLPDRAVLKETCCRQLRGVPAECRCRALRLMVEAPLVVGADPGYQRMCRRFAPAVVSAAECRLLTVHGWPFCSALDAE